MLVAELTHLMEVNFAYGIAPPCPNLFTRVRSTIPPDRKLTTKLPEITAAGRGSLLNRSLDLSAWSNYALKYSDTSTPLKHYFF